ncbi:MAG: hypothetical protein C4547_09265 [Phycisphaerales bacterium]|nr:MAG: hypothetical protein C4547_09265 [Phycisphaerales bacterium]
MARLIAFEDGGLDGLRPLLLLRTVFELRVGRKILLDRVAEAFGMSAAGVWTRPALAGVAPQRCAALVNQPAAAGDILVNGRWVCTEAVAVPPAPSAGWVGATPAYVHCDDSLARQLSPAVMRDAGQLAGVLRAAPRVDAGGWMLNWPWELIRRNAEMLERDFSEGEAAIEADLPGGVIDGPGDRVHVGVDTRIHRSAVIDATGGPVYVGERVRIGPCAVVEGPIYVGPGTIINPHAWLHGGNSIGPVCKIGGEVNGCIIHGYTNKVHAGFLGHSYVGSWVNLGAGTTNSNLKNTYGTVRVSMDGRSVDTGERFFGALIGDHVKTGIQSTIPTGANLGAAAVIATSAIIPKEVKPLTWLTDAGAERGDIRRLLEIARTAMGRRDVVMTDAEQDLFQSLAQAQ